ncbi:MAG: type VI secretion protein IcmF/TssM N-terminal domain-containing protein [Alphaproteobacteria bacterium]
MDSFFLVLDLIWPILLALLCLVGVTALIYQFTKSPKVEKDEEETTASRSVWRSVRAKLQYFFARYGYLPKDQLTQSFLKALESIQGLIGEKQSHYQLPWFMMIGVEGNGKSSLLKSLQLKQPISQNFPEESRACDWYFYDHGIVIDVKGDLIVSENDLYSNEQDWRLLLDLLANHRSKRPLDGIILTISAEELLGKIPHELLMRRADRLYMKLWEMQRTLGVRLPVYFLITKCDLVAGFSSFCQEIPEKNHQDILGWSNPYSIETAFSPIWVEELFDEIGGRITRLQQEIFAQGQIYDERDGVFVFPKEFRLLKNNLKTYLEHLFKENIYHESFFLRGVYFCGSPDQSPSAASTFEHVFQENTENQGEIFYLSPETLEKPELSFSFSLLKPVFFTTNLFKDKIFPEKGIVKPVRAHFFLQTQSLRLLQVIGFLGTAFGIYGLINAYDSLQGSRNALLPHLNKIKTIVKRALEDKERVGLDHVFFEQQAQIILNTLAGFKISPLQDWLIPVSWVSPLEKKMEKVITLAYDKIIFRALFQKLQEQVHLTIEGKQSNTSYLQTSYPTEDGITPLATREFQALETYVNKMHELQTVAIKLKNLPHSESLQDLAFVVKKLFNTILPEDFYSHKQIYQKALAASSLPSLQFNDFVQPATQKLRLFFGRFLDAAFDLEKIFPDLGNLIVDLKKFMVLNAKYTFEELQALNQHISGVMTLFNHPYSVWLLKENFEPGAAFHEVIKYVASSYFFSESIADTLTQESNLAFQEFKVRLSNYRSPLTGQFFTISENNLSFSPDKLLHLQGLLNLLFSEPFMSSSQSEPIQTSVPTGSYLLWNFQRLQEIESLLNHFDVFMANKLLFFPKNFLETLRFISASNLRKNLQSQLAKSQVFIPRSHRVQGFLSPEEVLLPEIQNIRAVSPVLGNVLGKTKSLGMLQLHGEIKKIVLKQGLGLLENIDQILESEGPYTLQTAAFEGDVSSLGEADLKSYVTLQRERIRYLAKEFAEPVVQLLRHLFELDRGQIPALYRKWSKILVQLNLHAKNTPGNSIASLETFILKELPQVKIGACLDENEDTENLASTDFFLQKQRELKKRFSQQCQRAEGSVSKEAYQEIASYFNTKLAGRFPFVKEDVLFSRAADVSVDDLQTFYQMLGEKGDFAKGFLDKLGNAYSQKALHFLEKMENLQSIFGAILEADQPEKASPLLLDATFRGYTEQEANGNHIISCHLKIGDQRYDLSKNTTSIRWGYAQPIEVQFRWASGSRLRPLSSQLPPHLTISGLDVSFQYQGKWALLRMMRQQKSLNTSQTEGQLLRFEIPCSQRFPSEVPNKIVCNAGKKEAVSTAPASKTVLFMKLNESKDKKMGNKGEEEKGEKPALQSPDFPTQAPTVSSL